MKKILFISLIVLLVSAGAIFADGIALGDFPLGKWIDDTYGAVWEFSSNNIRILDVNGNVYYDFKGKTIQDFKAGTSMKGIEVSFYCVESARRYKFLKTAADMNLEMTIDKDSGIHYVRELGIRL